MADMEPQKLMLLEMLTYLDHNVFEAAGCSAINIADYTGKGVTVGEFLREAFDIDDDENSTLEGLEKLKSLGHEVTINGAEAEADEWAAIIDAILADDDLSSLVLVGSSDLGNGGDTQLALCFAEPGNSTDAIVLFKGTTGSYEWADDFLGATVADTVAQEAALDYIDELPYSNITVAGHSKGGNKAMYVAVRSDKVTKCVSMDGQGFSDEFMAKYADQISKKWNDITNYSLDNDFVHPLMNSVGHQKYCEGYGVNGWMQNHSPTSFFKVDENGNFVLEITETEEGWLAKLTRNLYESLNDADPRFRQAVIDIGAVIAGFAMGGDEKWYEKIGGILKNFEENDVDFLGDMEALLEWFNEKIKEFTPTVPNMIDTAKEMIISFTEEISNILNFITGGTDVEIEIDTNMLNSDINELKSELEIAQLQLSKVFAAMQELDTMWDGPANEEFMRQFASDSEYMTEVCQTVQSLLSCMEYARSQYDDCDNEVSSLVASV